MNNTIIENIDEEIPWIALIYCIIMVLCCIGGCIASVRCPQNQIFP